MRLSLRALQVAFRAADGDPLPALGPISLEVAAGEFVCIVGPSGCGKSTLIRVLAGLQRPSSGTAAGDGAAITKPAPTQAIMFQDANLMPWRTVLDNIALPLEMAGVPRERRYQRVCDLLPQLRLDGFAKAYPAELSGGMAQRVALGRVMVQDPQALLLDEPFGALDAMTREKLSLELLQMWRGSGRTVVMVTHDINEAALLADRVVVLSRRPGQVVADLAVDLPRPRHFSLIYTAPFLRLARELRAAIEDIAD